MNEQPMEVKYIPLHGEAVMPFESVYRVSPRNSLPSPADGFFVRARYDIDSETDLAAFAEPLLLPGGGPHDFIGESW